MKGILVTLAKKVGIAISDIYGFVWFNSIQTRVRTLLENFLQILRYNTADIFSPYLLAPDLLVHKDDCSRNRSECWCAEVKRFVEVQSSLQTSPASDILLFHLLKILLNNDSSE